MNEANWIDALAADELPTDDVLGVAVDGHDLALYTVGDAVYATDNTCTHGQARLCDGFLDGHEIECPLHQGRFDVRSGQRVRFHATGEVRWGPGRKDGPGGEGGSHSNPARPMPSRPGAALIGRVGQGNDLFFIGDDEGEIRVRNSGRLYLGINDDFLNDNSGAFSVRVLY